MFWAVESCWVNNRENYNHHDERRKNLKRPRAIDGSFMADQVPGFGSIYECKMEAWVSRAKTKQINRSKRVQQRGVQSGSFSLLAARSVPSPSSACACACAECIMQCG